jgi:hypothetical protein
MVIGARVDDPQRPTGWRRLDTASVVVLTDLNQTLEER